MESMKKKITNVMPSSMVGYGDVTSWQVDQLNEAVKTVSMTCVLEDRPRVKDIHFS